MSFGIGKKNVTSHPVECATYLEDSIFFWGGGADISSTLLSFPYLQQQKVVPQHSASFN
jgi:hypothetical protein